MEHPPKEPTTPEEWENEVLLTKVRDRLVLIKNQSDKKFIAALALVDQSDEFISYGSQLELFMLRGSDEAKQFAAALGYDYNRLVSADDEDYDYFASKTKE